MKISVVIPTYNSAKTIEETLNSVLTQTNLPDEILIMDDGSTDNTIDLLRRYISRITLYEQRNQGVAQSRNFLFQHAQGDIIAFLDHDDVWHPDYLATQLKLFSMHPEGAAFFTGHDNFHGYGNYQWNKLVQFSPNAVEVIAPLDFISRYHSAPGFFTSMSLCCIPKAVLNRLGADPFCSEVTGVDDFHLYHRLLLLGPIVSYARPLVAYRITSGAQSASLLKAVEKAIRALELLDPQFSNHPDAKMCRAFKAAYSAQRREYGKVLMGIGLSKQARRQFWISLTYGYNLECIMKALRLVMLTRIPSRFQPR